LKGVVAASHHLASEAGAEMLRDGGNAIDAAIAANAVLCVVYPHMTSIGGDLFALVWPAGESAPVGLEGAGRSGEGASIAAMRERGFTTMPERGAVTVTVPGTVQAWGRLIERFGTVGLGRALAPAAALAGEGFKVTENLARRLHADHAWLSQDPEAARTFPPLAAGMTLRQPDLATTLAAIGRNGFGGFYFGELGRAIAEAVGRRGGFVTAADMAGFRSQWVEPLAVRYRDLTVYEMPPPTQGLVAMAMLARLNLSPSAELLPGPALARRLAGLRDIAYGLRSRYLTDPEFATIPSEPFLDPLVTAPAPTDVLPDGDTVYLCAADAQGNLVSLIQSVAYDFGSGVVAEGTGILLQNRGCYFSLDPAHVNRLEPRKRTMHTLIPALAARGSRPLAAFGTMAGEGQPQIQVQVAISLFDRGLDPAEAVAAPRVRVSPGGEALWVEADYPGAAELNRSPELPRVELVPPRDQRMGHAQALVVDGAASWRAGADPRADGSVEFSPA
jgi:gamma-glutamyltranspeptidase/glutathione hydrolase